MACHYSNFHQITYHKHQYLVSFETGLEISPFYDAMVAKIIAWGPNREVARKRLLRALRETALFGVASNRDYLIRILEEPVFAAGRATTAFVTEQAATLEQRPLVPAFARAAVAAVILGRAQATRFAASAVRVSSPLLDWSSAGALTSHYSMTAGTLEQRLAKVRKTVLQGRRRFDGETPLAQFVGGQRAGFGRQISGRFRLGGCLYLVQQILVGERFQARSLAGKIHSEYGRCSIIPYVQLEPPSSDIALVPPGLFQGNGHFHGAMTLNRLCSLLETSYMSLFEIAASFSS